MQTPTSVQNRKAYHDYEVLEKFEAGIALKGSEVKSIRDGQVNLMDSFAVVTPKGEVFAHHLHIGAFKASSLFTPEPYRLRKLLLHKKQIVYLANEVNRKHLALVPLSLYFLKHTVKIELGLCRGRKSYDKRHKIADQESRRDLANVFKNRNRYSE